MRTLVSKLFVNIGKMILAAVICAGLLGAADPPRNDWYWNAIVTLHFDNHSQLLGRGETVESLTAKLRGIPVSLIEVSAYSGKVTYPSQIGVMTSGAEEFDTPAVWKQVAQNLGVKFGLYMDVMGDARTNTHPEWLRVDATGKRGDRTCFRPGADGHGYLEDGYIPLVQEIIARYHPDSLWYDGDWSMPLVDYCDQCKGAWKAETGAAAPPTSPSDPDWRRWVELEARRLDQYKEKLAGAIHAADPHTMYIGNWSWAISARDPRQPPDYVDTLSGDVGAGTSHGSLYDVRFSTAMLSAQEHTPYDMMTAIYPKPIRTVPRVLQEDAMIMASGGACFLWIQRVTDEQLANARRAANFVQDRRAALGRSHSLNPIAVLLSETEWAYQRPVANAFDWHTTRALAFALQDQGATVDVVNEAVLLEKLPQYRAVFVANQEHLAPAVKTALASFSDRGGKVVTLTGARIAEPDSGGVVRDLMRKNGIGPVVEFPASNQIVASLRHRGDQVVLHLADLTSYKNGQRVEPNSRADIDENHPIEELHVVVAAPTKPRVVSVVPAATTTAWKWKNGRLTLTLRNFNVHAAVLMNMPAPASWPLLPAAETNR